MMELPTEYPESRPVSSLPDKRVPHERTKAGKRRSDSEAEPWPGSQLCASAAHTEEALCPPFLPPSLYWKELLNNKSGRTRSGASTLLFDAGILATPNLCARSVSTRRPDGTQPAPRGPHRSGLHNRRPAFAAVRVNGVERGRGIAPLRGGQVSRGAAVELLVKRRERPEAFPLCCARLGERRPVNGGKKMPPGSLRIPGANASAGNDRLSHAVARAVP